METVQRVSIVQQVQNRMLRLIEDGTYKPGEKLPVEKELCQQMSVGRGTVREAFRLLQARGYVEIKPGRGAFVAEHIPDGNGGAVEWLIQNEATLRDAIEVRHDLEPLAARRMAEKGSSEAIQRLETLHSQLLEAIQRQDCPAGRGFPQRYFGGNWKPAAHRHQPADHPGDEGVSAQDVPGPAEYFKCSPAPHADHADDPKPGRRRRGGRHALPPG